MTDALLLRLPGLTPYREAWDLQKRLVPARQEGRLPDVLLLLEHTPVITLGRRGGTLMVPRETLAQQGIEVYEVERGGQATYHGPGQLVAYPILHLGRLGEDVVRFVRLLEESIIRTVEEFGVAAQREPGSPGVWVDGRKLAAVGVAVKRRVTMHGMALNVTTDLGQFRWIDPCGLGRPVTSLAERLGRPLALDVVADAYARRFAEVFGLRLRPVTADAVARALGPAGEGAAVPVPVAATRPEA